MNSNAASPFKEANDKTTPGNLMDPTRIHIKGPYRGHLLWKTLKNLRKYVAKVSDPLSKSKRRSLRRQLSFQVDDLERIVLGVKPQEDNSETSGASEDEEMRGEVEAIVKDAIEEASSSGRVVNVDYFENRMKQVEKECAELKRKMEEISGRCPETKRKKREKAQGPFSTVVQSPFKLPHSGYGSDDHGYEGSMDFQIQNEDGSRIKREFSPCNVCGKFDALTGWRCVSCRNFWSRLVRAHANGKLLPMCNHWEPSVHCKGCRRRKYETAQATHAPNSPLGIPPCPPPSVPEEESVIMEQSREIKMEYW